MIAIIPMYIGIFVATILTHFTINWIKYMEGVRVPPLGLFIFVNGLLVIQVTVLATIAFLFGRKFHMNLLASPYKNFAIGFLFSLSYILLLVLVIPNFDFLNKDWFVYVALPVLIFLPLMCADHLLFPR